MNTRSLALPLTLGALLFALGCNPAVVEPPNEEATTAPTPREKVGQEAEWAELLIGKWKRVEPGFAAESIREYTRDGWMICRTTDKMGTRQGIGRYRLDGAILTFDPSNDHETPAFVQSEIWERTRMIESITKEKLVTVVIIKKRYTPKEAQSIAESHGIPVEPLLAEVREEREHAVYERVKDE